jgi:hypothetical protein
LISDPVSVSGQLSQSLVKQINGIMPSLSNDAQILPGQVEIFVQCFESIELRDLTRMKTDLASMKDLKISSHVNKFSSRVLENIDVKRYKYKALIEPSSVVILDSMLIGIEQSFRIRAKVIQEGVVHGFLYFFKLHISEDNSIVTFNPDKAPGYYKQSIILADSPLLVNHGEFIEFEVKLFKGLLSIKFI